MTITIKPPLTKKVVESLSMAKKIFFSLLLTANFCFAQQQTDDSVDVDSVDDDDGDDGKDQERGSV